MELLESFAQFRNSEVRFHTSLGNAGAGSDAVTLISFVRPPRQSIMEFARKSCRGDKLTPTFAPKLVSEEMLEHLACVCTLKVSESIFEIFDLAIWFGIPKCPRTALSKPTIRISKTQSDL